MKEETTPTAGLQVEKKCTCGTHHRVALNDIVVGMNNAPKPAIEPEYHFMVKCLNTGDIAAVTLIKNGKQWDLKF